MTSVPLTPTLPCALWQTHRFPAWLTTRWIIPSYSQRFACDFSSQWHLMRAQRRNSIPHWGTNEKGSLPLSNADRFLLARGQGASFTPQTNASLMEADLMNDRNAGALKGSRRRLLRRHRPKDSAFTKLDFTRRWPELIAIHGWDSIKITFLIWFLRSSWRLTTELLTVKIKSNKPSRDLLQN